MSKWMWKLWVYFKELLNNNSAFLENPWEAFWNKTNPACLRNFSLLHIHVTACFPPAVCRVNYLILMLSIPTLSRALLHVGVYLADSDNQQTKETLLVNRKTQGLNLTVCSAENCTGDQVPHRFYSSFTLCLITWMQGWMLLSWHYLLPCVS